MPTGQRIHAYITIPKDCLPLVMELVNRLGGMMTDTSGQSSMPMPETERGGKMLQALRLRAGMTQKALAEAIGLPQSHISEFEKNRRAVPYKHAQKLAVLLHSIPSHFMMPKAETIAAMNEAGEKNGLIYDTAEDMYKDLGI
ncbi:MAG: helix-turn-helix domain-containing protein [Desulfobulbaceae bacterium]|jgi:transcriptional regulator with XRE-family HTH domain|nr:helix-turn-helix domain-containing protein [Desulfobulbaceae bacterium]